MAENAEAIAVLAPIKTVSIGLVVDGEFEILGTLNNNSGIMSDAEFEQLKAEVHAVIKNALPELKKQVVMLHRQDVDDSVVLEEEDEEAH